MFDFNLSVSLKVSPALNAKTVIGPAEATLPTLAALAGVTLATSPSPTATVAAAEKPAGELPVVATAKAAATAATTADNPNHNHNAIHNCNNGSNRTSGGGGGSAGNRSSVKCDSSINGCSGNSSGGTSSDCNGSNYSGTSSNGSRSSSGSSSSSSSSSSSGSSSGSGCVNHGIGSSRTATRGNGPTCGNDEEGTRHGSPTGRRTREYSAGTEGDKSYQLEESRPAKKARTSYNGIDGADAAAGPATAAAAAAAAAAEAVAAAAAGRLWGGGAPFILEPALETPLRKDQVRVELSEAYSRKPHPDREVRTSILNAIGM